jgi:hypothetical protein
VLQALDRLEEVQRDPRALAQHRAGFSKDLHAVLRMCDLQDKYQIRQPPGAVGDERVVKLRRATVARLIVSLAAVDRDHAADTIAEFLLLDLNDYSAEHRFGDVPAELGLFEIGEPALPVLHRKILSSNGAIRHGAALAAATLLGPSARDEFSKWLREVKTEEERAFLIGEQRWFEIVSRNTKGESPDGRRAPLLREGRRRFESKLRDCEKPSLQELHEKGLKGHRSG